MFAANPKSWSRRVPLNNADERMGRLSSAGSCSAGLLAGCRGAVHGRTTGMGIQEALSLTTQERKQLAPIMSRKMVMFRKTAPEKMTPGGFQHMNERLAKVAYDMMTAQQKRRQ